MKAPIIAYIKSENRYHLLSGNTRLCIAHAQSIRPKVVILEIPNPKK